MMDGESLQLPLLCFPKLFYALISLPLRRGSGQPYKLPNGTELRMICSTDNLSRSFRSPINRQISPDSELRVSGTVIILIGSVETMKWCLSKHGTSRLNVLVNLNRATSWHLIAFFTLYLVQSRTLKSWTWIWKPFFPLNTTERSL